MIDASARRLAQSLDRSSFLRLCAGGVGALAFGTPSLALADNASEFYAQHPDARVLWVRREGRDNSGTPFSYNKRIPFSLDGRTLYWKGYLALCAMMRDVRVDPKVGDVYIDVKLIQALYDVHVAASNEVGHLVPIHLDSVFRTNETNLDVGGVTNSEHLYGRAADFYVPELTTADTMQITIDIRRQTREREKLLGGVGYYPGDGHVHGDAGPFYTKSGGSRIWGPWPYSKTDY